MFGRQWFHSPTQNTKHVLKIKTAEWSHLSAAKYSKMSINAMLKQDPVCWLNQQRALDTAGHENPMDSLLEEWNRKPDATTPQLCSAQVKSQKAPAKDERNSFQSLDLCCSGLIENISQSPLWGKLKHRPSDEEISEGICAEHLSNGRLMVQVRKNMPVKQYEEKKAGMFVEKIKRMSSAFAISGGTDEFRAPQNEAGEKQMTGVLLLGKTYQIIQYEKTGYFKGLRNWKKVCPWGERQI